MTMILRPPLFFGLLATVAMTTNSASSACFGGVPTYEKSTGYTSTAPMGSRLVSNTRSVLDCLTACSNLESCKAFKIDHQTNECQSFEDRTSTSTSDPLIRSPNINYFEKLCLMVNLTYFRTMCGDKKWAFQRVRGAYLDFPPSKKVRVSSRAECARICFVEKDFTCRSANFDRDVLSCELLPEDRRTQASSFRRDENSKKDYLENQCSVRVIQSCQYDSVQNRPVANPDHEVYASTKRSCIASCDSEKMFFCRSYTYNSETRNCQLSGDDKASMADTGSSPSFRQGVVSGERACILLRCAGNTVTYERVTGRYISSAKEEQILTDGRDFSTLDCLRMCTNSGSYCPGLHVDYQGERCYKLDRNTQSSGTSFLPKLGTSYFEQVCLKGAARHCSDKAWAFERLQGFELLKSPDDQLLSPVQNRIECEEACLKALDAGFVCRSATYDGTTAECRLSRNSRRTRPQLLRATRSLAIDYLENQCVSPPVSCEFVRHIDFLPQYPDVTVKNVRTEKECQRACESATNFICWGVGFRPSAAECRLSGNAQDGNPLMAHRGAIYFDKICASNGGSDISTEDPQVTFLPVSSGGKCIEGSQGEQSYERTTGFTIKQGGQLIYNDLGSGIVSQCKQICDKDKTCNGFTVDYMTSQCHSISAVPTSDFRNTLEMVPSSSFFEAVCSLPTPTCHQLWNFERRLNKELRGFDRQIYRGISKAECQQRCLAERRFQCRSASYSSDECRLSAEDRSTQPAAFVDADGVDYLENQCAFSIRRPTSPTWNAGGNPGRQTEKCEFINRVEGSALDYVDKIVEVSTEQGCRDRCRQEQEFNCRSISFINQGAGKITCYLSAETRNSMGAQLRPVPASVYEEISCSGNPMTVPPTTGEGTTCENADEYTFERVMGMLPKTKPSSEIVVSSSESPTSDCLRECLRAGDKCLGVAVHYSGGAPYSSPCSAYDKIISTDPRNLSPRADTAYYAKICIKGTKCDSVWTVERVPGYALVGFDSRRLQSISTREECMEKCFEEKTCRSVQFFPRAKACHLSSETRRSQPFAFRFQGGDVQYMENQCTQDPSSCNFVDMPNMFLPYADRTLTSIVSVSDCKQECSQEQDFMCRSIAFDARSRTCSLSACDRQCNPAARAILIQKMGCTYSERSSCSPQRPIQPIPPLPRPPYPQPFPPPQPPFPQPMPPFPRPMPYPPPMPPPLPVSVLGRNAERREDSGSQTNCIPLYIRTTGMAPTTSPTTQLNVSGPIGTTYECSAECTRWQDQCVAFVLQAGSPPCFAYDTRTEELEQRNGVAYFRKECFKGTKCSKLWAFDHIPGYEIQGFDKRRVLNVNSLYACAEMCFQESTFKCRSAEYIGGERTCQLSTENRLTQPDNFIQVVENDVDYLENQCS